MYWQLWLPFVLGLIGYKFSDWLDAYNVIAIPYMVVTGWSLMEFLTYLAERA